MGLLDQWVLVRVVGAAVVGFGEVGCEGGHDGGAL